MPIPIRCTGCSRTINAPDHAAGKRVKCPACATVLTVATPGANSAAAPRPATAVQPAAASPPAFAAPSAPAFPQSAGGYSPFAFDQKPDESVLTESDFQTYNPVAPKKRTGPEIPQGKKKVKRPASFYKVPAVFGLIASGLNITAAVILVVVMIIGIVMAVKAGEQGLALLIGLICLRMLIFAGFTIGGGVQSIFASLNLMYQTSRTACGVAVGEFFFNPIAFGLLTFWMFGWIVGLIVGGIFALWNWPCMVWFIVCITGEQAKIDFEEIDDDELEELAAELQRRAAMKEGGH